MKTIASVLATQTYSDDYHNFSVITFHTHTEQHSLNSTCTYCSWCHGTMVRAIMQTTHTLFQCAYVMFIVTCAFYGGNAIDKHHLWCQPVSACNTTTMPHGYLANQANRTTIWQRQTGTTMARFKRKPTCTQNSLSKLVI